MSVGTLSINDGTAPIGYSPPPFPSLSFSFIWGNPYQTAYLYETFDIWRFTVYWFLILSIGFHIAAACLAAVSHRRFSGFLIIALIYGLFGAFYGFAAGSITGIILAAVYTADGLHMSTWIPFSWGLASIAFMAVSSSTSTMYAL